MKRELLMVTTAALLSLGGLTGCEQRRAGETGERVGALEEPYGEGGTLEESPDARARMETEEEELNQQLEQGSRGQQPGTEQQSGSQPQGPSAQQQQPPAGQ